MGLFSKFKLGFKKTAQVLAGITSIFSKKIDASSIDELEEALFTGDFGFETTQEIVENVKEAYKKEKDLRGEDVLAITKKVMARNLENAEGKIDFENAPSSPIVICLIGVNGSGKTTTAAKLAYLFKKQGKKVLLAACDTFRAAANEQIKTWSDKLDIDLISSHYGADSASVAFDGLTAAKKRNCDVLIIDTAGRLHTKTNLMNELKKIKTVLQKIDPTAPQQSWIVVDGSLGSNSIEQAKVFNEYFSLNGMIITKLDGTSKGGAIAGIYKQLKLPVYYVGLGESEEDLQEFTNKNYLDSIFGE